MLSSFRPQKTQVFHISEELQETDNKSKTSLAIQGKKASWQLLSYLNVSLLELWQKLWLYLQSLYQTGVSYFPPPKSYTFVTLNNFSYLILNYRASQIWKREIGIVLYKNVIFN